MDRNTELPIAELLRWYLESGVDETIGEQPLNRYEMTAPEASVAVPSAATAVHHTEPAKPSPSSPSSRAGVRARAPIAPTGESAVHTAADLAGHANTLEELRDALMAFNGCALKSTATNLVFADGNPRARIVLIGEAPGAEEDRKGLPFVGPSGRLLDRMLASIDLDRNKVLISNIIYWRPPGNRNPSTSEVAMCMPFVERLLELVDPDILVALGGPSAKALLGQNAGIGKLRGRWFTYQTPRLPRPIAARAVFHPAYLLRSPAQKRLAWRDLLAIREKIQSS
jgi:DNA polymerase